MNILLFCASNVLCLGLLGDVFGPLEFSRRDLMAVNIQRGRDHGLADYNSVREAYGLDRKETWEEVNPTVAQQDPEVSGSVDCNLVLGIWL